MDGHEKELLAEENLQKVTPDSAMPHRPGSREPRSWRETFRRGAFVLTGLALGGCEPPAVQQNVSQLQQNVQKGYNEIAADVNVHLNPPTPKEIGDATQYWQHLQSQRQEVVRALQEAKPGAELNTALGRRNAFNALAKLQAPELRRRLGASHPLIEPISSEEVGLATLER